jgi:head-tail adaptor
LTLSALREERVEDKVEEKVELWSSYKNSYAPLGGSSAKETENCREF